MKKKIISLINVFIIIMILIPNVFAESISMAEFEKRVNSLKGYTNVSHIYNGYYGGSSCYKDLCGWSSWECMAWACKVYDTVWKQCIHRESSQHTNVSNLCVGDYVRYRASNTYDHSIFITKISGNDVWYTDGNGTGTYNAIRFDVHTTKSNLQALVNKTLLTGGTGFIKHCNYNNLGIGDKPVDLGTDFYAVILHRDSWKPITYDDDGYIRLRVETGSANQVWYFRRQSDGSYTIASTKNDKLLELTAGDTTNGKPVSVGGTDWGGNYQRWYIYEYSNGYIIKSKHYINLNRVLDLRNNETYDGNDILTYERNNGRNQIFAIYKGNDIHLGTPTLEVKNDNGHITFNWSNVYGEYAFDLTIQKDGSNYKTIRKMSGESCTYSENLPTGTYSAYVTAVNAYEGRKSNVVEFDVARQAPTQAFISVNKKHYNVGENVMMRFLYNNADSVSIGIDKDGQRIATPDVTGFSEYKYCVTEPGEYTAYVSVWNPAGFLDSEKISFTVDNEKTVSVSTELNLENEYTLNSKIINLNKSAVYIAALYDSNGNLLNLKNTFIETDCESCVITLPSNNNGAYIKTFLWDNKNEPLTESETIDFFNMYLK